MDERVILKELSQMNTYDSLSADDLCRLHALLSDGALRVPAKALWIIGEVGFQNSYMVSDYIVRIHSNGAIRAITQTR